MKRRITVILLITLALSLCGCNNNSETDEVIQIEQENGNDLHVILPLSKKSVWVPKSYEKYLDDIDPWLLRSAEKKITKQVSKYNEKPGFGIRLNDKDQLELYAEVIVDIDPPKSADDDVGCGIDHDHLFFCEPITK